MRQILGALFFTVVTHGLAAPNWQLTYEIKLDQLQSVEEVAFSRQGNAVAVRGQNGVVQVWGVPVAKKLSEIKQTAQAIALDGGANRLVTVSNEEPRLRVWIVSGGKLERSISADGTVAAIAFSPDDKRLIAAVGNRVKEWDLTSGKLIRTVGDFSSPVAALSFRRDGRQIAAAGIDDGKDGVQLWSYPEWQSLKTLRCEFPGKTCRLDFSPDGAKLLIAHTQHGPGRIWNVETGKPEKDLRSLHCRSRFDSEKEILAQTAPITQSLTSIDLRTEKRSNRFARRAGEDLSAWERSETGNLVALGIENHPHGAEPSRLQIYSR